MKKNLAKAITLGLMTASVFSFGGMNVASAANITTIDGDVTKVQIVDKSLYMKPAMSDMNGKDYKVNVFMDNNSEENTKKFIADSGMVETMKVAGSAYTGSLELKDVNINITNLDVGYLIDGARYDGTNLDKVSFDNLNINIEATGHPWGNPDSPSSLNYNNNYNGIVLVDLPDFSVKGNTHIYSNINLEDEGKQSLANNGLYAQGSTAKLLGDTYINVIIPKQSLEVYGEDYKAGISKNDAVTSRDNNGNKGLVEINQGTSHKVQILGNLDFKGASASLDAAGTKLVKSSDDGGTIKIDLNTPESYWHGEEVRRDVVLQNGNIVKNVNGYLYDIGKDGVTDIAYTKANLELKLSNGGQWVPDREVTAISKVTLNENGVINTHGLNRHTNQKGFNKELHIGELNGKGGIFRMDINANPESYKNGKNGGDFVYIKSGNAQAYIQPIFDKPSDVNLITPQNPVWFADAAEGISFQSYLKVETLEDNYLYDYFTQVDKNVNPEDKSIYGNNWYLVKAEEIPEQEESKDVPEKDLGEGPKNILDLNSAAQAFAVQGARLEIDSLNKRLGELRNYKDAEKGVWVRYKTGERAGKGFGQYQDKFRFYQIGYDGKEDQEQETKGRWHKGFAVHYAESESASKLGSGDMTGRGVSLYQSWEGQKGHYQDFVARYSHLHNDITITDGIASTKGDYSNYSLSASYEWGRKNKMKHDWMIEPQAQLVYTYLSDTSYTMDSGLHVKQDDVNSLIGRIGFRLGREYNQDNPNRTSKWYVKADVLHEFMGESKATLTALDGHRTVRTGGHDTWFEWGFGGDIEIKKNSHFYCDFERSFGGDVNTKWVANVGLRWEW